MKIHRFILFTAIVMTFAVAGPPAMAQTADGSTPAEESICDPLMADGITKGLYGLCVAYCEAQDFSSEEVPLTEEEIMALLEAGAPSGKILENYNKRRTTADPEMPCVVKKATSCPCYDEQQIYTFDGYPDAGLTTTPFTSCHAFTSSIFLRETNGFSGPGGCDSRTSGCDTDPRYLKRATTIVRADGSGHCSYRDTRNPDENRFITSLTPGEAAFCAEVARTAPCLTQ